MLLPRLSPGAACFHEKIKEATRQRRLEPLWYIIERRGWHQKRRFLLRKRRGFRRDRQTPLVF